MSATPVSTEELLAQAGWVRALARRLARDAHSAEDLVQGTFAAALERPPEGGRPLRPWLARVALNLLRKERRGASRREATERHGAQAEPTPPPDTLLAELEQQQRLARLVTELPEPQRGIVLRRYYRCESAATIARATGVPAATVRSQLARGLAQLRVRLQRDLGGDSHRTLAVLALAAGRPEGLVQSALTTTSEVLAMNTTAKAGLAVAAVTVLGVGTLGLRSWLGDEVYPAAGSELSGVTAPEPPPDEPAGSIDPADEARVAVAPEPATVLPEDDAAPAPSPAARATTVTLRAVDEDGTPLAGAWLEVTTEDGLPRELEPSAPSGALGRVTLELARGSTFQYVGFDTVNAYLALHAPGRATDFYVGQVRPGATQDHGDVVLRPGGRVEGRVFDAHGQALEGALVIATSAYGEQDLEAARLAGPERQGGRPNTRSRDGGRFELAGVDVGELRVWAGLEGSRWAVSEPLQVTAGGVERGVLLTLEPLPDEAAIAGLVLDPAGAPVEGAAVHVAGPGLEDELELRSGPDGRFHLFVPTLSEYRLVARDPGARHGPSPRVGASPGGAGLELRLTPLRTFVVRVRDREDRPLAGAWALALCTGSDFLGREFEHADERGELTMVAESELFRVRVGLKGFETVELGPFRPEGLPAELVARLESHPFLSGRVLAGGRPVEGARVRMVADHGPRSRDMYMGFLTRFVPGDQAERTDEQGRFELPVTVNLERAGIFALLAEKEGYALTEHVLADFAGPDAGEIELELGAGGVLTGTVLAPKGRSPGGLVVAASRGDGLPRVTRTDEAGRYRFEHMTPGPWRVEDREREPEGRTISRVRGERDDFRWNCEVLAGRTTELDLDLRWQADLSIAGRLAFSGVGAEGWSAVLEAPEHADRPYDLRPGVLDAEGRFSVEAQPGDAKLVLRSPPGRSPAVRVVAEVVVDAERRPFDLDLPVGSLAGQLLEGAAELRIFHRVDESTHVVARFESDDEGRFEAEGLPAGEYTLQREESGPYGPGWYPVSEVRVEAGERTTVE